MVNNPYVNKCYGLYRAIVVENKDPEKRGRIRVYCPSVMRDYTSNWCIPCKDLASISWALPPIQSSVWITFEEGNVNKPIWMGSWWVPNNPAMDTATIDMQRQNWGQMIVNPKLLPVKDLNGNLENYFGYKTPFGGVYWKKDYDNTVHMKLDCIGGELNIVTDNATIHISQAGDININGKSLTFNGSKVATTQV